MSKLTKKLATMFLLGVVYFGAGKLGLSMAFVHPSATAVWPPTGISLAALMLLGFDVWPGIWLGAFVLNMATAGSWLVCAGVATGNTLEGVAGAYLITRFAGGRHVMERAADIFKFSLMAGMLCTTISPTIGVTSLLLGGYATTGAAAAIWQTWWLGDATGAIVVAPLLLLWFMNPRLGWRRRQFPEALGLLASIVLVNLVVFGGFLISGTGNYPLEYLLVPFVIWAAFRFGQKEAVTATSIVSGIAIWGTLHGFGPFARASVNESLLFLQAFLGITAVVTTAFAAEFLERQKAEGHALFLAASDPLTGLGNYRKLFETLEAEIKRSDRSRRSFGFLLIDLDGLKSINDRLGHQAGDRALCRLARVLQVHCRETDLAARHGGDEFALVLPEAGVEQTRQVARRIATRLAEDGKDPKLSASIGVAVFPQDGQSIDALLQAADQALYAVKREARLHNYFPENSDSGQAS